MLVVTGAAGFIGSAVIWELNRRGRTDIVAVDTLDHEEKRHNVAPLRYERIVEPLEFLSSISAEANLFTGIVHLGAISSTREQDWSKLLRYNVQYTQELVGVAARRDIPCVYASSAAVYGDGSRGYTDDHGVMNALQPLNLYGSSKLEIDRWTLREGFLSQVAGVRYFNVFGPNEYHKGDMRSVVCKSYPAVKETGTMTLYRSYNSLFPDGEQKRDFVYVKDVAAATIHLLDIQASGIYNVGSGRARSWNEIAQAMFGAVGVNGVVQYIDMPEDMRRHYQYFSEADTSKLRASGYAAPFSPLEDAVREYVTDFLLPHRHLS